MAIYHLSAGTLSKIKSSSRLRGHSATASFNYQNREGKYSRKNLDKVLYKASGHMPEFAVEEPKKFWFAADRCERKNGRLCKKITFALPRELTLKQQIVLAAYFSRKVAQDNKGGPLPYSLAIHAGKGTNPHCHLMVSERVNDRIKRRTQKAYFARANTKNPENGGFRKTEDLKPKSWLLRTRAEWAHLVNRALESIGSTERVDHRSHKDAGIDRPPSTHIGPHWANSEHVPQRVAKKKKVARVVKYILVNAKNGVFEHKGVTVDARRTGNISRYIQGDNRRSNRGGRVFGGARNAARPFATNESSRGPGVRHEISNNDDRAGGGGYAPRIGEATGIHPLDGIYNGSGDEYSLSEQVSPRALGEHTEQRPSREAHLLHRTKSRVRRKSNHNDRRRRAAAIKRAKGKKPQESPRKAR